MERKIGRSWPNLFQDVAANKSSLCRCCECSVVNVGAIIWIHLSRRDPGLPRRTRSSSPYSEKWEIGLIKQSFPGRSDNDVKNRYHCIHSRLYSVKQPKMAPSLPMPSSLKPFPSLSCTFQKEIPLSDSFPLCEQFSEQLCEQEPLSFSGSDCFGSSELYDPSSFFTPSVSESCLTGF